MLATDAETRISGHPERGGGDARQATISGVALSNGTGFTTPATSGTTIDSLTATCSVGSCIGATFALATTGACSGASSNSSFAIVGSNLNIGGSTVNSGTYPIGIAVTLSGASNSGICFPFTLTGSDVIAYSEEFVGPFASWVCARSAVSGTCGVAAAGFCNAVGDGSADDTAAIQTCMNGLSSTTPVVYFPSGTYKITTCLHMGSSSCTATNGNGLTNISIVCADPATTTIRWNGSSGGTMFHIDGVASSRIDRCKFDANHLAAFIFDDDWASQPNCCFPLGNQYADDIFTNAGSVGNTGVAIRCGITAGCSERSLLRDSFINNASIGVITMNFNALNVWCWYCTFQNNDIGLGTAYDKPSFVNGAGQLHVFNSIFQNSVESDVAVSNIVSMSVRDNYSTGSGSFFTETNLNTGFPVHITGNIILDSVGGVISSSTLAPRGIGPLILLDNTIRSAVSATAPVVDANNGTYAGNLLSMGNTFTLSSTGNCGGSTLTISISMPISSSRCHEFLDQIVSRGSVNPPAPTLPPTPPNLGRTIFEAASLTGAAIQTAITNAAAACANNVAHIPAGNYTVTTTITVPANCAVQIIGDGFYSNLLWSGAGSGPVLKLQGPSLATLREFQINVQANLADAIEIDNADQPGSRVYSEGLSLGTNKIGYFSDGLDYTNNELHDFLTSAGSEVVGQIGLNVVGGPSAAAGTWLGGATSTFANNAEGQQIAFAASNGGHLLVRDNWLESGAANTPYTISGQYTTFTYAGASIAFNGAPAHNVASSFQGTSALVGVITSPSGAGLDLVYAGNGSGAQDLVLGAVINSNTFNTTSPADTMGFLNSMFYNPVPPSPFAETGPSTQMFLTTTLAQLRNTHPTIPGPLASGVTNVQIYRVFIGNALKCAVHVTASSGTCP